MDNYKIAVTETTSGYIKVNARNEEHALNMVEEMLDLAYFVDVPRCKVKETECSFEVVS